MTDSNHVSRQPGEGRYSFPERERRWRVASVPAAATSPRRVEDWYLRESTLRVRQIDEEFGPVFKLTQKVRREPSNPMSVRLTNMYLSRTEFDQLRSLPGDGIVKERRTWSDGQRTFAVDRFLGRHEGLYLVECEVDEVGDDDILLPWDRDAVEVSHDDRFSGGSLSRLSDTALAALLAQRGI